MATKINNHTGSIFSAPIKYMGLVLMLVSIAVMISGGWAIALGISLLVFGAFFFFSHSGIILDTKAKKVKPYTSLFGIKNGRWREVSSYPNITILSRNKQIGGSSIKFFEITLLSKSLRGKVLIDILKDYPEAERKVKLYQDNLGVEFVSEKDRMQQLDLSKKGNI